VQGREEYVKSHARAGCSSLGHRYSSALQKKIQLARADYYERHGDLRFNARDFEVVPIAVPMPHLPPAFDSYRIVHISDLHLGQWLTGERLKGVVDLINKQDPDLVAITGDFVSYALSPVAEDLASSLEKLSPRDAAVAVLGNHDHWVGAEEIREILRRSNIIELKNDVFTLTKEDANLHIAGLDDVIVDRHRLDQVMKKLPPAGPAILLVHEPDFADVSAKTGRFSLQLSGHSHGGQLVIPHLGTPFRGYYFKKYPLGRYQVEEMVQYTNRGLGTNLFWSRINCPPEITVLSLRKASIQ
jgi:predicted MPP superfamily phosphohydrolase